jgi:asparagine synthetase B (glutamine-hydrolysing)
MQLAADLRGSYTLLVWDERSGTGAIVCDHLSLRPCFLFDGGTSVLRFGTDLPALRRLLGRTPAPEPLVVVPWLAPHFAQGRKTAMAGVERLGGAHLIEFARDASPQRRRYWRPEWRGVLDETPDELAARVHGGLESAIGNRLATDDTPTGVALSGGLDSSVVMAVAASLRPADRLRSYSTVFPRWPAADESIRIGKTRAALGVPGAVFEVEPQGAMRLGLEYLRDTGSMLGGPGLLVERPGIERAASDGVRIVLDGQGGDETFGYAPYLLADRLRRGDARGVLALLRRMPDRSGRPTLALMSRTVLDFGLRPALPVRMRRRGRRRQPVPEWLYPSAGAVLAEARDPLPWLQRTGVPRWWAYMAHLLTESREGSGLAEYTWQRGARFGLRAAGPLFDVDLAELMLRMPPLINWQRRNRPLARAAVAGLLPDDVRLARRKANLGPFYLDVITGPDSVFIRELLLDRQARIREWVPGEVLERHAKRRPTRSDPDWLIWGTVQWRMAILESWLRWLEDPTWVDDALGRDDLPTLRYRTVA